MGIAMSSSTSDVSESDTVSQKPSEQEQASSDQLKNGGEQAADQLKNGGEAQEAEVRDADIEGGDGGVNEEEEEEEGECGFCLFMKGGGCTDSFTEWEKCVEEAEKNKEDVVEKCFQITSNLKKCMEAHADYYEPILKAEKAAEAEVAKESEIQDENNSDDQTRASDSSA